MILYFAKTNNRFKLNFTFGDENGPTRERLLRGQGSLFVSQDIPYQSNVVFDLQEE